MRPFDWTEFAVGGAAARPDSFTGLQPVFASNVYSMVTDAHAAGVPLQITSAYRSPELQAQLYDAAIQKYGSPEAARKWVAPPGRSKHNSGTAVDFAVDGSLIRDANSPAAQWIAANAGNYGLSVPMSWEPWQVEPMGSRSQQRMTIPNGDMPAQRGIFPPPEDQLDMGTPEGMTPEKHNGILSGIGEELMAMDAENRPAPVQFAPMRAQPVQAAQRDPMAEYLRFAQSVMRRQ